MIEPVQSVEPITLKTCCATLYESDWARLLLGNSFHPGGLALTERLGQLLDLKPTSRVLDVAAGNGTSTIFLAQRFGCEVIGLDYGTKNIAAAIASAAEAGASERVRFKQGDAESSSFDNGEFDAVICECAFCTFSNKRSASAEFARVLRPGGRVGLSDLTRSGPLCHELDNLLAWIACLADAQPIDRYTAYLEEAGFTIDQIELHDDALSDMVDNIRTKLMGAELLVKLKKLDLPDADFEQAKGLARTAVDAVHERKLGYALIVGIK